MHQHLLIFGAVHEFQLTKPVLYYGDRARCSIWPLGALMVAKLEFVHISETTGDI